MRNQKYRICWHVLSTFLVYYLLVGCAAQKVTTGAFTNVSGLDSQLKRGVSTKMEVQRLLGAPNGFGNAIFPTDSTPRKVWYYEDIEATDYKNEEGVIKMNMRQQILLIFFKKGVFDGYMWSSNAGKAEGQK